MRLRYLVALFFISGAVASPTVVIDAELEGDIIHGTMTLKLDEAEGGELRLYLPGNRDRDPSFAGPVKEMGLFSDNALGAYPFEGRLEVNRITANGEDLDNFTIKGVRLIAKPVAEGPLEVSLDFTARVPDFRYHWGRTDGLVVLSGWHPQPWPMNEKGDYLDARELPWGVFPARPADYSVRLVIEPGLNPLGPATVDGTGAYLVEGRGVRGMDLVLVEEGRFVLDHEVWSGLSVELADLTGDETGEVRLHFAREVFDRCADWFGRPEGRLTIVAADLPQWGGEYYDGLVLLGDVPSYPLLRLPELAFARQMAGRWFRTGLEVESGENPFLVEGLAHWAAREALTSIFGQGRDLVPVPVLGFEQEWLARTLVKDLRLSRLDRPPSAPAETFAQPETYDAAVRQKTAQALLSWSRRWGEDTLREAVSAYLEKGARERATPGLFLDEVGRLVGREPAAELAEALGLDAPTGPFEPTAITPREVEKPGFELRLLPDALEPEAWTLCFIPFPWPDYDDTWRLGAALWGRRGINLLPMEIWGADDLLLSATRNLEHGDWNLLAQYTNLLNGSGPRLGVAAYSRRDEQGGTVQLSIPLRPRLSHPPEYEFTLGLNYCRLRNWDPGERPLRLRGEDGRQLSLYGSFYLNGRGALGGPQLYLGLEYAFDPLPHLDPGHPPFDYGRFLLLVQEDLRFAPWLWALFRGTLGHIEGYAPAQRRFELTEDDVSFEYHLIRLPQAGNIRGYNDLDLYADDMALVAAELFVPVVLGLEVGLFYDYGATADGLRLLFTEETPWRASFGPVIRLRMSDTIYAELNFPLWVSRPYTDEAEPGGNPWAFRWDFDARIGF